MVHELRTPITVISGYATLLADERLKYLHPEAIENILRAAKRLEIVLNDAVDDFRALSEKPDTPAPLTGSPLVPDTSL
jgi:signal transduction histidine kinase